MIEHLNSCIVMTKKMEIQVAVKNLIKKKNKSNAFGQLGAAIHKTCYENICVTVYFKVQINGESIKAERGRR